MKGQENGLCNLTACTTKEKATYYNYGSMKWYCLACADMLNEANGQGSDSFKRPFHDRKLCHKRPLPYEA